MFTVTVGRRLIAAVNRQDSVERSPREFFDTIYFPLFFGKGRFLQNVNNSPVDQAYKNRARQPLTSIVLTASRDKIHEKIENEQPDGSFFLGGPAKGTTETTSGQVTSMERTVSSDEIYASWIGSALGIGISGGLSLLIDSDDVLLALYDGWFRYRRLLDETEILKPNQINSWNGQWLAWRFGHTWNPESMYSPKYETDISGGQRLITQTWVQLLFAIAHHYSDQEQRMLTAYVYSFGQMNRTVGFIRLDLPEVRRPFQLYRQLFTVPQGLLPMDFEKLYETEFSFFSACEQGSIGLRALQPKGLRKYMPDKRGTTSAKISIDQKGPEQQLTGQIYETWIIAMLNNKELLGRAQAIAEALHAYTKQAERSKATHQTRVDQVLAAGTRRTFVEGLTTILNADGNYGDLFEQAVVDVLDLPESSAPLFFTLIRFEYARISHRPSA